MAAAATPFDFSAFDAPAPIRPSTIAVAQDVSKTYTQKELNAAVSQARKDAVKSIAAAEALKQTALLEVIATGLTDASAAEIDGLAEHIETLTNVAQTIVTEFCVAGAIAHQTETALAMIDRYLKAANDGAGATLVLSSKTTKRGRAHIEKALAEHGGDHIAIVTDASLTPGDVRLEWRGGAMTRTRDAITEQIKDIFAATKINRTPRSLKKEIPS